VVKVQVEVFQIVTPCNVVVRYQCFRGLKLQYPTIILHDVTDQKTWTWTLFLLVVLATKVPSHFIGVLIQSSLHICIFTVCGFVYLCSSSQQYVITSFLCKVTHDPSLWASHSILASNVCMLCTPQFCMFIGFFSLCFLHTILPERKVIYVIIVSEKVKAVKREKWWWLFCERSMILFMNFAICANLRKVSLAKMEAWLCFLSVWQELACSGRFPCLKIIMKLSVSSRSSGLWCCSVVVGHQCFGGPCCLHLHGKGNVPEVDLLGGVGSRWGRKWAKPACGRATGWERKDT